MNKTQTHGYKLASKGKRFIASLVEGIIFILLTMGIYLILGKSISEYWNSDFELIEIVYSAIAGIIVGAIFYPLFIGNLGHRIFNLKVISAETGKDYNKAEKGAIRECLKYVLGYLLIPIIWILWDEKNQNLYDKLTKTLVVENKIEEPKSSEKQSKSNKYEQLDKLKNLLDNGTLTNEEYENEKKKILEMKNE